MTDLGANRKNSQNIATVAKGQGGGERPAVSVWRLHMPQILTAFADFQFHGSRNRTPALVTRTPAWCRSKSDTPSSSSNSRTRRLTADCRRPKTVAVES